MAKISMTTELCRIDHPRPERWRFLKNVSEQLEGDGVKDITSSFRSAFKVRAR